MIQEFTSKYPPKVFRVYDILNTIQEDVEIQVTEIQNIPGGVNLQTIYEGAVKDLRKVGEGYPYDLVIRRVAELDAHDCVIEIMVYPSNPIDDKYHRCLFCVNWKGTNPGHNECEVDGTARAYFHGWNCDRFVADKDRIEVGKKYADVLGGPKDDPE